MRIYIEDIGTVFKIDKFGDVFIEGDIFCGSMDENYTASLKTDGNIKGEVWEEWSGSGDAKQAINDRIESRAAAIADQKIATALNAFKNNPIFTGTLSVNGDIKATGNIEAFSEIQEGDEQ